MTQRPACLALTVVLATLSATGIGFVQPATAKPLDIEDVLKTVSIDQVDPSPDGRDLAVVIQRPVSDGEVFGRTAYEIDPSRADVWLVARDGSAKRNLTQGAVRAAGFWCPQWSPDGKRLAMLSTKPEGKERRGGDSVRLYVWERQGGRLKRLSDRAVMTQTRYGASMNQLDLRLSGKGQNSKVCRRHDENSPFLWLDDRRLLVVQMPPGQNSALFSQYGRPAQHGVATGERLRSGRETTVDIADSDRTALAAESGRYAADLVVIDAVTGQNRALGQVPMHPFRGLFSLLVSPGGSELAVFAPTSALPPPTLGEGPPLQPQAWVQNSVAVVALDGKAPLRWFTFPAEARYPLDPLEWSPDGRSIALRARGAASDKVARVFTLDMTSGAVTPAAPGLSGGFPDASFIPHQPSAFWIKPGEMVVRGREEGKPEIPERWWRVRAGAAPEPVAAPAGLQAIAGLPPRAEVLASDGHGAVWLEPSPQGLRLRALPTEGAASPTTLLSLDEHLAAVGWGEVQLIDYTAKSGQAVKGQLILPPGHRPGMRHPLLVWVYPGTTIRGRGGYWDDPFLPGIYNLQLYAARGYAVLVPSMPFKWASGKQPIYDMMGDGVLPAVDRVVAMGIADPSRVGLFGQSFGGYAVYALVSQTDRFAAAAAMSGFTDLAANHGAFDPGAIGWPGVAQDKSAAATVLQMGNGMGVAPYVDPAHYAANSPLTYVGRVRTPLLMAHGSLDLFSTMDQPEAFFTELDRQGKPARLLRYEGDNHSLAGSPANVRHLFEEIVGWFDRYLKVER